MMLITLCVLLSVLVFISIQQEGSRITYTTHHYPTCRPDPFRLKNGGLAAEHSFLPPIPSPQPPITPIPGMVKTSPLYHCVVNTGSVSLCIVLYRCVVSSPLQLHIVMFKHLQCLVDI